MSLTWANAAKKRGLTAKGAREAEEGGAAVAVPSRPGEAGSASAPSSVAVDSGAGRACGLDLNDFIVRADAVADEGVDGESFLFSEVGDSHDSIDEAVGVAEDAAVAASGRVQRQTCPVYKAALAEQRLKRWM